MRGSVFLASQRYAAPTKGQRRVVANGLRELDRMLNLLIEAVAASIAPRGFDAPAFRRERNAARKLGRLAAMMPLPHVDGARLRALGRVRDCLFHCDGTVHSPHIRIDLDLAADRPESGSRGAEKLAVSARDLVAVCEFYGAIAALLLAAAPVAPPPH